MLVLLLGYCTYVMCGSGETSIHRDCPLNSVQNLLHSVTYPKLQVAQLMPAHKFEGMFVD